MNIRNLNASIAHTEYAKAGTAARVNGPEAVEATQQAGQRQAPQAEDRLELSDAARAAHGERQQQVSDLAQAREALDSLPGLSEERAAQIRTRLEEGYYTRPEVASRIAERLTAEVTAAS